MLFWAGAGNKEVVNVTITEMETMKHLINEALKSLCGVTQAEGHRNEFK